MYGVRRLAVAFPNAPLKICDESGTRQSPAAQSHSDLLKTFIRSQKPYWVADEVRKRKKA